MIEYVKSLEQNERKILRELGVKFGRFHIFLFKLIKPDAVSLRTLFGKIIIKNILISNHQLLA